MAQPAMVQANGVPGPERVEPPPAQSFMPMKRKREVADEDSGINGDRATSPPPAINGSQTSRDEKKMIRDYYEALRSFDVNPPILKRPLPDATSSEEPDAKRRKSEDATATTTIADKIKLDEYKHLDDVASDVVAAVKARLAEIRSPGTNSGPEANLSQAVADVERFRASALEYFRRETSYPLAPGHDAKAKAGTKRHTILSVFGNAPQGKQLFSSVPRQDLLSTSASSFRGEEPILPSGVLTSSVRSVKSIERKQNLSELVPAPKAMIPLQPSKAPKPAPKGNVLGFYHPEFNKSTHRSSAYFDQRLALGHYLDYTNATPSSQNKTKQRERAQSLAGHKPSTTELEMSEMEALFRGAFSSFAPCRDDSAATVPSSLAGRMWWQRTGQRGFNRMIESEYGIDEAPAPKSEPEELDEGLLQTALENWDDSMVDPSLDADQKQLNEASEREVEELLQEISDLTLTLASYQDIRNGDKSLTQKRFAGEPDMLKDNKVPPPSEEETTTYEALKAQLALIIKMLPPYAVAKLNGDRLDELLVSTRVETCAAQYSGILEEDEAAVRARIQQQQAAAAVRQAGQRTSSASATPYPPSHYQSANQYGTPSRTAAPAAQYYRAGQTPAQHQPNSIPRPVQQSPHQAPRPPQNQAFRPPNGLTPYAQQLAKTQTPYGHQGMPQFTPGSRQQQPPGYGSMPQHGSPNTRFAYAHQSQAGTPSHAPYQSYTNGAGPPRNAPQLTQVQGQPYSPSPYIQQQQRYTPQGHVSAGTPVNRPYSTPMGQTPNSMSNSPAGLTGYHTVMPESQQQRMMEQARARMAAQERSSSFGDKIQGGIAGLAGIGLGGSIDVARIAAARASLPGGVGHGPRQQPAAVIAANAMRPMPNGVPVPSPMTAAPATPSKITPVPVPVIPHQSTPLESPGLPPAQQLQASQGAAE